MNGITSCFTGRLGADAELRYLASGSAILTFSVAIDDQKRSEGDPTEWCRVAIFGELAEELAPRLLKGTSVYCEGRSSSTSGRHVRAASAPI